MLRGRQTDRRTNGHTNGRSANRTANSRCGALDKESCRRRKRQADLHVTPTGREAIRDRDKGLEPAPIRVHCRSLSAAEVDSREKISLALSV